MPVKALLALTPDKTLRQESSSGYIGVGRF